LESYRLIKEVKKLNLTLQVLLAIDAERTRQNQLWGKQRHDIGKWLAILGEEFGEVAQAMQPHMGLKTTKDSDANDLYKELIQVAAVSCAFAEQIKESQLNNEAPYLDLDDD
jgi:NTP pyrophosphatase (non-canonical NTP hydrolase)